MITNFSPKLANNFTCMNCNYICSKISDFNKHVLTLKHKMNDNELQNDYTFSPKLAKKYICECGKEYKHRQGLYAHKSKCVPSVVATQENIQLTNLVIEVIKSNGEMQKQNQEFQNKILETFNEVMKNGTNNNTLINNNSHNKTFNLQIFLNETCKDAMNIMDFVDSLKLQLCDLERIGEVGFVTGISDIIIKNLKALDVSKRPIHCADTKREVMYVKDNDKWEKEQEGNKKLKKAIKHIAKKNSMNINLFKDKYPDCINSHSRKSDQFNKIYIEAYGGSGNEDVDNENKIIKNIAKVVAIDKSCF